MYNVEDLLNKLQAKGIKLKLLLKLSYLNSNSGVTLSYLNPALNNPALAYNPDSHLGLCNLNP